MKALLFAALLTMCDIGIAAPFLVSDPYPKAGPQPDSFTVQLDSTAPLTVPATVNADGSKQLRMDVGPLGITNGSHMFTVKAVALSGVSAAANFPFTWALPDTPANLRLIGQ